MLRTVPYDYRGQRAVRIAVGTLVAMLFTAFLVGIMFIGGCDTPRKKEMVARKSVDLIATAVTDAREQRAIDAQTFAYGWGLVKAAYRDVDNYEEQILAGKSPSFDILNSASFRELTKWRDNQPAIKARVSELKGRPATAPT